MSLPPHRHERETDDEIRTHLAHRVDALIARGLTRREAEDEALRRFGPYETGRAEMIAAAKHRDRVLTMYDHIDAFRHDVFYSMRRVRRSRGLAIAIAATFALGVGANATMFGLLDRLLLRPPAHVTTPERLVRVQTEVRRPHETYTMGSFSYPGYVNVRDNVHAFTSVAMTTYPSALSFGLGASAHAVKNVLVSGNYFQTLGTTMELGRPILPSDDVLPSGSPVVVISDEMWRRDFGGDANVLGKAIALAGHQYTVIGVAPRDFTGVGTQPIDVWIPVSAADGIRFAGANWANDETSSWMQLIARLAPGMSERAAGDQVAASVRSYHEARDGKRDTTTFAIEQASYLPNRQPKLTPEKRVALLLGGVSVVVLLIACANVANLLLARALRRRREIAVRLALGIARGRLMRQLVLEGIAFAAIGGLAALVVVQIGSGVLYRVLLADSARPASFIDLRILIFTAVATIVVGVVTALVPAWQATRPNLTRDLKDGTYGAGVSHSRTRVALLLAQAALSVVLLAGTGAFLSSLRNVNRVNLGIDSDHLVVGTIDLRSVGVDSTRAYEYFREAVNALKRVPGVQSVVAAEASPFTDWSMGIGIKVPGRDSVPSFDDGPSRHGVSNGYFRTVGTRILRGREFDAADLTPGAEPVIIINEDGARRLWPKEDALGKCIVIEEKHGPCTRIVGIAEDTHRQQIVEKGSRMQVYTPLGRADGTSFRAFAILARTSGDPGDIVEPMRHVMQTVWGGLPYANVRPMRTALEHELRPWRLGASLFGVFGAIALALSALGLYSVISYSVTQRMHEMGVRVALGAQVADIVRLVLSQGLAIAALGVGVGIALALAGARLVQPLLYETSARDPIVLGAVAATLLAVATVASLMPAWRATRVDPLTALRSQ